MSVRKALVELRSFIWKWIKRLSEICKENNLFEEFSLIYGGETAGRLREGYVTVFPKEYATFKLFRLSNVGAYYGEKVNEVIVSAIYKKYRLVGFDITASVSFAGTYSTQREALRSIIGIEDIPIAVVPLIVSERELEKVIYGGEVSFVEIPAKPKEFEEVSELSFQMMSTKVNKITIGFEEMLNEEVGREYYEIENYTTNRTESESEIDRNAQVLLNFILEKYRELSTLVNDILLTQKAPYIFYGTVADFPEDLRHMIKLRINCGIGNESISINFVEDRVNEFWETICYIIDDISRETVIIIPNPEYITHFLKMFSRILGKTEVFIKTKKELEEVFRRIDRYYWDTINVLEKKLCDVRYIKVDETYFAVY